MLDRIHLENFKVCKDIDVRLAPLTILSGLNSSGKSTLLQALGLIKQSYVAQYQERVLSLNGYLVELGRFGNVLSENADREQLLLEIWENGKHYSWMCQGDTLHRSLKFAQFPETPPEFITSESFQFITADRRVPEVLFPQPNTDSQQFLGIRGEYTADFLARHSQLEVRETRCLLNLSSKMDKAQTLSAKINQQQLIDQTASWLQYMSPGVRLESARRFDLNATHLQFFYSGRHDSNTKLYLPTNVGFGLTYCLPIIVACLAAPSGSLLLLENPEAHLHPQGQAALGELLARCASDDVQIIVETHSDHFINGIRLAVKNKLLRSSDVAFHFFTRRVEDGEAFVQSPTVLDSGRLSNWPDGFFDQWDKSLDLLLD